LLLIHSATARKPRNSISGINSSLLSTIAESDIFYASSKLQTPKSIKSAVRDQLVSSFNTIKTCCNFFLCLTGLTHVHSRKKNPKQMLVIRWTNLLDGKSFQKD